MSISKSAVLLAAVVIGLSASGVAAASAAPTPVKAVGVCAKKVGGSLRLLEPKNLARSRYGACKSSEKKVVVPTLDGVPKIPAPPATVVFKRGGAVETCTKTTDTVLTYDCKTAPAPSPSPSS